MSALRTYGFMEGALADLFQQVRQFLDINGRPGFICEILTVIGAIKHPQFDRNYSTFFISFLSKTFLQRYLLSFNLYCIGISVVPRHKNSVSCFPNIISSTPDFSGVVQRTDSYKFQRYKSKADSSKSA